MLALLTAATSVAAEVDKSFLDEKLPIDKRAEILVSQMTVDEMIKQMVNASPAIPRLGVPAYNWYNEALHGVARNGLATIFPQAIGMAATFDPELIEEMAEAVSTEARAKFAVSQAMGNTAKYAGITYWAPVVNLFRDARHGRGQESYGEDPYLVSRIGVAFVKGMQGSDPDKLKVAACAKHFAMHAGPEKGKLQFNAQASPQDLQETFLPAFKALVTEAKVEGVMTAYNMVQGVPASMSKFLLSETLRDSWKFDGYVTSDCGAIVGAVKNQGYVDSVDEAAALSLEAGVNTNCGGAYRQLAKAYKEGRVSEKLIRERCTQLFKTRFRLGFFDDPKHNPYSYGTEKIHSQEHIDLSRKVAQKSIVLLKNENNVLPLSPDIKVPYVTGPFANSNDVLMGSYYGISPGLVTIMEGVAGAVSYGTSLNYRSGSLPYNDNINPRNFAPYIAGTSDAIICVVGTTADMEGEGVDAIASPDDGDRLDLRLPKTQTDYIHELLKKKKKGVPFILVIASGGTVILDDVEEHCDAILQIWYPGEQGGNAVADILFGKVSPSGRLPVTYVKGVDQLPDYASYDMKGRTYKYMTEEPRYPFGFGLSYSKSVFSGVQISNSKLRSGDDLKLSVDVKNTGEYDMDEVVQLYICPESIDPKEGNIPLRSLKAFKRVALKKGESRRVDFTVESDRLKVVDLKGQHKWRKGNYTVVVGASSPGELSTKLGAPVPQSSVITLR
ncbi:MAG: glycoside hydrolase family 3 N-terminal domain-containing protein [Rikenellaceae bacterium]